MDSEVVIPEAEQGANKDFDYSITANSRTTARNIYAEAKRRLLSVVHWHALAGSMSADFKLTDTRGKEIEGPAYQGAFLKINIPGPGTTVGKGYDWVQIQSIKEQKDTTDDFEWISMTLRPAASPLEATDDEIAHFFDEAATSTFIIERNGFEVSAHYHGRNEVPNTKAGSLVDKFRNAVVALSAMLGFSDMQWKALLKHLIEH